MHLFLFRVRSLKNKFCGYIYAKNEKKKCLLDLYFLHKNQLVGQFQKIINKNTENIENIENTASYYYYSLLVFACQDVFFFVSTRTFTYEIALLIFN